MHQLRLFLGSFVLSLCAFAWSHEPLPSPPLALETYKKLLLTEIEQLPGWCSQKQANCLLDIIQATRPSVCVEIGVYRGRSLVAIAGGLKFNQEGLVHAIDTWEKTAMTTGWSHKEAEYKFWNQQDLACCYTDFMKTLKDLSLQSWCVIHRQTAQEALSHFQDQSIDFLHIDANKSEEGIFNTVYAYYPKLKEGGYLLLNGANSSQAKKAVIYLLERGEAVPWKDLSPQSLLIKKSIVLTKKAEELCNESALLATRPTHRGLFYWRPTFGDNFGDYLSKVVIERLLHRQVPLSDLNQKGKVLLSIGSILQFARDEDVVWGSGVRAEGDLAEHSTCTTLDVRAVRGPLTRASLLKKGIACPEVYGDPALLFPRLFPEFTKQKPDYDYIIIPNIGEIDLLRHYKNIVLPTDPWDQVVSKILRSKFVISSSLHGLIIAEAYGIPAKLLKMTQQEPLFKYQDYYMATGRPNFSYATSVQQALAMGGEPPLVIDLEPLLQSFPYDYFSILFSSSEKGDGSNH